MLVRSFRREKKSSDLPLCRMTPLLSAERGGAYCGLLAAGTVAGRRLAFGRTLCICFLAPIYFLTYGSLKLAAQPTTTAFPADIGAYYSVISRLAPRLTSFPLESFPALGRPEPFDKYLNVSFGHTFVSSPLDNPLVILTKSQLVKINLQGELK